jgi:hypothetical protein
MRAERSWSLLDPKPVLLYLTKHDEYIVYWNGWVMTHSQALCHAVERCGIYPTPSMKLAMQTTFERLYYSGAFQTRSWDSMLSGYSNIYDYQKLKIKEHVDKVVGATDFKDVLEWFNYDRARMESISTPLEV